MLQVVREELALPGATDEVLDGIRLYRSSGGVVEFDFRGFAMLVYGRPTKLQQALKAQFTMMRNIFNIFDRDDLGYIQSSTLVESLQHYGVAHAEV